MTKVFSFLFICLTPFAVISQWGPQQIISTNADGANSVIPYDVDNDGIIDVISASFVDSKIAWYKNIDGLGNFGSQQIISVGTSPVNLEMYDVDGDGLLDLVFYNWQNKIVWLKNIDGMGNFSGENILTTDEHIYNYKLFDYNGNGHLDIIAILFNTTFDQRLVWYENINGDGNFSNENLISVGDHFNANLAIVDINNDGLPDIVTSIDDGYSPSKLVWMENNGQGNYSAQQDIFEFQYISDWMEDYGQENYSSQQDNFEFQFLSAWMQVIGIFSKDLNGNGLNDLVILTQHDDLPEAGGIWWLENLGGSGNFNTPQLIHNSYPIFGSVRFYDLDDDGHIDILLSYSTNNGKITWHKNTDGQGNFGPEQVITTQVQSARDATAADLNGNGFLDIISASAFDDKIAWYEYVGLSISDFSKNNLTIYPNPAKNLITIDSTEKISEISLFNVQGRKLDLQWDVDKIDISNLTTGIYLLKVTFENYSEVIKKIVKQ